MDKDILKKKLNRRRETLTFQSSIYYKAAMIEHVIKIYKLTEKNR